MVVFDSSILFYLLNPEAKPPRDPETQEPLEAPQERLKLLVSQLSKQKEKIAIPTPVLAEVLVKAGSGMEEFSKKLKSSGVFRVVSFDDRAAIECAIIANKSLSRGCKKGGVDAHWQKIKIDRQIIAIALVEKAKTIYTDDRTFKLLATDCGLSVLGLADLPLPEAERQGELQLS